jgi:hypothetical protein
MIVKNMHEHIPVRSCKGLSGRRTHSARSHRTQLQTQAIKSCPAIAAPALCRARMGHFRK